MLLGAKTSDIFISTGPPERGTRPKKIKQHWKRLGNYYHRYEYFLRELGDSIKEKNQGVYKKLITRLDKSVSVVEKEVDRVVKRGKHKSSELKQAWQERVDIDKQVRSLIKSSLPEGEFDQLEDIYLFDRKIYKFNKREDDGIMVVQEDITPLISERRELVELRGKELEKEPLLREEIGIRMALYDDIPLIYSLLMSHREDPRSKETKEKIELIVRVMMGTKKGSIESLFEEITQTMLGIVEEEKSVVFNRDGTDGVLQYGGNKKPVSSLEPLNTYAVPLSLGGGDDETTTLRVDRPVIKNQVITHEPSVIEKVALGFMMEKFLSSDITEEFANWTGGDSPVFDRFRSPECNCLKRSVILDGDELTVLVATRNIKKGEDLFLDYEDTDLYRIWTERTTTIPTTTSHKVILPQRINKVDDLIATLSAELTNLLINGEDKRRQIDFNMRIEALRRLQK